MSAAAVVSLPYTASTRNVFPKGVAFGPVAPVAPVLVAVPGAPVGPVGLVGPVGPICLVPTFPTPGMYLYSGGPDSGGTTLISYSYLGLRLCALYAISSPSFIRRVGEKSLRSETVVVEFHILMI